MPEERDDAVLLGGYLKVTFDSNLFLSLQSCELFKVSHGKPIILELASNVLYHFMLALTYLGRIEGT